MGKEFVKSVCMVCMLCTIHTHCSVHHNINNLSKTNVPPGHTDRHLPKTNWSEPFEPVDSALNPQLDIKQFKNSQPGKHKHLDGVNDNIEDVNQHWGPIIKVSDKSVNSVPRSESSQSERLISNDNVEVVEQKIVNPNSDTNREDLSPLNSLDVEIPSVLDSKTQKLRISRETKILGDLDKRLHIRKVFDKFGNGETMTFEGFEQLLKMLGLERLVNEEAEKEDVTSEMHQKLNITHMQSLHNTNSINNNATQVKQVCLKSRDIFSEFVNSNKGSHVHDATEESSHSSEVESKLLDEDALYHMCPSLLYQLTSATAREKEEGCFFVNEVVPVEKEEINMFKVWLYSTLSILGISFCGLLGVAVIPIMQHVLYQQILQFLVALAVGTLSGDALLHLLPHAMMPAASDGFSHDAASDHHEHSHDESGHDQNMWRGFVAAVGVVFFFVMEKCLLLGGEWLKQRQRQKKVPGRVRIMRDADVNTGNSTVGEKLCKHKYSSYPYCYGEITTEITDDNHHKTPQYNNKTEHNHNTSSPIVDKTTAADGCNHITTDDEKEQQMNFLSNDHSKTNNDKGEAHELNPSEAESYTVIIREHENVHHGHSHSHGHVHAAPGNLSSVACMVIMGDGLHNLTDGMAIGAAFAANLAGGFSTALAVFCHELPHELGDFAVLLKAGMSLKEAIFYNLMSSFLCLLGMIGGVLLGRDENVIGWVFALAAGMFLYIALVDMIPELSSGHSKEGGSVCQFILQILGLLSGLGIMLLIAMYEHNLKTMFSD